MVTTWKIERVYSPVLELAVAIGKKTGDEGLEEPALGDIGVISWQNQDLGVLHGDHPWSLIRDRSQQHPSGQHFRHGRGNPSQRADPALIPAHAVWPALG